jgi:hypothetical protein
LWRIALHPSNIRKKFVRLLCKGYTSHTFSEIAGVTLVRQFLSQWEAHFRGDPDAKIHQAIRRVCGLDDSPKEKPQGSEGD